MGTASAWTAARRAKQAEAVKGWKPWEKSTGPRTGEGKAKSSRNADKGVAALDARISLAMSDWRTSRAAELDEMCRILIETPR